MAEYTAVVSSFRVCLNRKSRANPDIQCHLSATHGDYCSRHYKNPNPFSKPPKAEEPRIYTRSARASATKIQKFWRYALPLYRYRAQGPAYNYPAISTNDTELFTLESIDSIPRHYVITFFDDRKAVWTFDIRTLVQTMGYGFPSENPYTRDKFTEKAKEKIHKRLSWLRARRYPILHISTDILTEEQCWNHRVLDVFLKIESLGYYASCDWYHRLTLSQHIGFYTALFSLWEYRFGLSRADKDRIVPEHMTLFRFHPNEIPVKSANWWKNNTLSLIEAFVTRSSEKEQQKLGAMYALIALARTSRGAAEGLPWLI
jgi:hypothetical protein